jgi:hypothetical protein
MLAPSSDIGAASPIAMVANGEAKLPVRTRHINERTRQHKSPSLSIGPVCGE